MEGRQPVTVELIRRAQGGDQEALNQLLARYQPRILAIVRVRLGSALRAKVESQDLLTEVMAAIWQHLSRFDVEREGAFIGWVSRLVENRIRDQARYWNAKKRHGREVPLGQEGADREGPEIPAPDPTSTQELLRQQRWELMEQALDRLPTKYREVLLQRELEDLTFREIGDRMDLSEDAVRMLHKRAWKALIDVVKEQVRGEPHG